MMKEQLDIPDELPGDWADVSDNTGFDYHWHRAPEEGDYPSIRADHSGLLSGYPGWTVEMYPNPNEDEVSELLRSTHDSAEDAADRVTELMEEYPHGEE